MSNIAIIGSGSWGVALATHLADKGNNIKIWSYSREEADDININKKCRFLPNLTISNKVYCYTDFEETIKDTEMVLIVTPSKFVRDTVKKFKKYITNQYIVICSKGFEMDTLYTLSEVVEEELPNSKIAVLTGPSHAEEVSCKVPTAIVVASEDKKMLKRVQEIFMNENLRIYVTEDIKGAETGGALKNIIALCAGIVYGLELGDNTVAALISRGLSEISKLNEQMGGKQSTLYGLTGLGDLIVTCLSNHSRNRRAGILIGKGKSIEEIKREIGMTIESIDNIEIAYKLSKKYKVEMPIVESVYNILFNNLDPKEAVTNLMKRTPKYED